MSPASSTGRTTASTATSKRPAEWGSFLPPRAWRRPLVSKPKNKNINGVPRRFISSLCALEARNRWGMGFGPPVCGRGVGWEAAGCGEIPRRRIFAFAAAASSICLCSFVPAFCVQGGTFAWGSSLVGLCCEARMRLAVVVANKKKVSHQWLVCNNKHAATSMRTSTILLVVIGVS